MVPFWVTQRTRDKGFPSVLAVLLRSIFKVFEHISGQGSCPGNRAWAALCAETPQWPWEELEFFFFLAEKSFQVEVRGYCCSRGASGSFPSENWSCRCHLSGRLWVPLALPAGWRSTELTHLSWRMRLLSKSTLCGVFANRLGKWKCGADRDAHPMPTLCPSSCSPHCMSQGTPDFSLRRLCL